MKALCKIEASKGFTLVELSIVLVIIGLIVSSILIGKDLISSAEIRSALKQYDEFNAATGLFVTRYDNLPGDANGTELGFRGFGGAVLDGNRNNYIGVNDDTLVGEQLFFWAHLGSGNAGLLPGEYRGVDGADLAELLPRSKTLGNWAIFQDGGRHFLGIYLFGAGVDPIEFNALEALTPLQAMEIDNKIDDGNGLSGGVLARGGGGDQLDIAPTQAATGGELPVETEQTCLVQTGGGYNVQNTIGSCNLSIVMSF